MKLVSKSESTDPQKWLDEFSQIPETVRKDPYRAGLLPAPIWQAFVQSPFPTPREFWICSDEEKTIGRIGANISITNPERGFIGFFEMDLESEEAFSAGVTLFQTASDWLKSQGVAEVIGPVNYNTWFPYRFQENPEANRSFGWEPVNPPEYAKIIREAGFDPLERYSTVAWDHLDQFAEKTKKNYDRALGEGYTFRKISRKSLLDKEVPILYKLSMASFPENFLFEPTTLDGFRQLYVPVADKMDLSTSYFVMDADGNEVGFSYAFEDKDDENRYMVLKSVGVDPSQRGKGLSNALFHLAAVECVERGVKKAVSALVREGIQSESYAKKGEFLWRHEYFLYKKEIS